jgi:hypothetical protein
MVRVPPVGTPVKFKTASPAELLAATNCSISAKPEIVNVGAVVPEDTR